MNITLPGWAIEAGGLIVAVVYVLNIIHNQLMPQLLVNAADIKALVAGHQSNALALNTLQSTINSTNQSLVAVATALPASPAPGTQAAFEPDKTVVMNQPVLNQPVVKEDSDEQAND